MRTNATKAILATGGSVVGTFFASMTPSAAMVELVGLAGMDFVLFDGEHGSVDAPTIESLVRAAELSGTTPLLRVSGRSDAAVLPYLDAGVLGVQVPHIRSAADVMQVIRVTKFHPLGQRGFTTRSRVADYGVGVDPAAYAAVANDLTMIVVQLEDVDAYENLAEIVAADGADVYFLASGDLSQSFGLPGQYGHPTITDAVDRARVALVEAGKAVGLVVSTVAEMEKAQSLGYRFIAVRAAGLITSGASPFIQRVDRTTRS